MSKSKSKLRGWLLQFLWRDPVTHSLRVSVYWIPFAGTTGLEKRIQELECGEIWLYYGGNRHDFCEDFTGVKAEVLKYSAEWIEL